MPKHMSLNHACLPVPPYLHIGTPKGIRTRDLLLRRQLLYPTELSEHVNSNGIFSSKFLGLLDVEIFSKPSFTHFQRVNCTFKGLCEMMYLSPDSLDFVKQIVLLPVSEFGIDLRVFEDAFAIVKPLNINLQHLYSINLCSAK